MKEQITDISAKRIRKIARELGAGTAEFSLADLEEKLGLRLFLERSCLRDRVQYLIGRGELTRCGNGSYRLSGNSKSKPAQKQQIMWRFLRMQKTVTVEDLCEVAETSQVYAEEWLRHLVSRGIVRDHENGKFQLIKDTFELPENVEKAEKLKAIRTKKKQQAIAILARAKDILDSVAKAVETL